MINREIPINTSYDDSPYKYTYEAADISKSVKECDLHGMRIEDALVKCDQFIDREFREGSDNVVKIIHGKGKGKLRIAIHNFLNNHPLVEDYRDTIDSAHLGAVTNVILVER